MCDMGAFTSRVWYLEVLRNRTDVFRLVNFIILHSTWHKNNVNKWYYTTKCFMDLLPSGILSQPVWFFQYFCASEFTMLCQFLPCFCSTKQKHVLACFTHMLAHAPTHARMHTHTCILILCMMY